MEHRAPPALRCSFAPCRTVTVIPPLTPPLSKARPPLPSILPAQSQSARPLRSQCRGTFCCRPSWGSGVVAPPATSLRLRAALAPRASRQARKLVSGVSSALAPPPSPPPTAPPCPPVRQYLERPVFPSHTMGVTSGPSLGALSTFCCRDPSVFPPANPYSSSLQSRLFPEAL